MHGFDEFLMHAKDNQDLQRELNGLNGLTDEQYCERFVAVGARHGYTFDTDDVEEFLDEVAARLIKNDELSDAELEVIAGGGKGDVIEGIGEAIISYFDSCP